MSHNHTALVKAVLQVCAVHRVFAFQTNTFTGIIQGPKKERIIKQGVQGMADILALPRQGPYFMPLWIECKTGTGKQSPFQASFQADVESRGHRYMVCRDWQEVELFFRDLLFDH